MSSKVAADTALREGPGSGHHVIMRVPHGMDADVRGCLKGNGWCKVSIGPHHGWVLGRLLGIVKASVHHGYVVPGLELPPPRLGDNHWDRGPHDKGHGGPGDKGHGGPGDKGHGGPGDKGHGGPGDKGHGGPGDKGHGGPGDKGHGGPGDKGHGGSPKGQAPS